jgi:AraC family transcriptional regulator
MSHIYNEKLKDEHRFRINRAIDCIQTNYAKRLNLNELARVACFSRFHFHRIFRSMMGETANEFLKRVRLERAASKLILDQDKSITEIALDCGFSSSQSFAKCFKTYYGITPSLHRSEFNWNKISKMMKSPESNDVYNHYRSHRNLSIKKIMDRKNGMSVKVKNLPSCRLAYLRCTAPFSEGDVDTAFSKLVNWALPRELITKDTLFMGVLWNNPDITPEEKIIYDACITVPRDIKPDRWVNIQTLPEGKFAVTRCEVEMGHTEEEWVSLTFNWLTSSNYMPDDRPGYEIYYNDPRQHPLKHHILDICQPIRPLDG